jgi:RNA polymerase sigma-70 factor (ECF subfamily)
MTPENHAEVNDADVLRRIAARDAGAFALFYDRHAPAIFALILRITQEKSEAEEALQEAFWQVWREAGNYNASRGSAMAWLVQLARSRAIDRFRQMQSRRLRDAGPIDDIADLADPEAGRLDQQFAEQQDRQIIRQAIDQLPKEQKEAICLAFFKGMTHQEISEKGSIPLGTIKTRIRLGLEKLHEQLKNSGVAL